jgi:hypothetical protein
LVNALQGDSYGLHTFDLPDMVAIAFDTSGTLYGALETGEIYSIDLTDGTYQYISTAQIEIVAVTFESMTNDLWATIKGGFGAPKDKIYKIDLATGDTTFVGKTGFNRTTNDLVFDENGVLYGIKGTGSQLCDLFTIDVNTGVGTIVGSTGLRSLTGLAYAETGIINDVKQDENSNVLPNDFALSQNYPNPFNPSTTIRYAIPYQSDVVLKIYNILGEEVITLINESQTAGNKTILWDGKDNNGIAVSSGVFIYRLKAGNKVMSKKMLFLK